MISEITDWNNVLQAYKNTQQGKPKYKPAAILFSHNPIPKLKAIQQEVANSSWQPAGYYEFIVKEPKERVIYAPMYTDKIVQHMVNMPLRNSLESRYIKDSYACIRGKGHLACIKAIQSHMRIAKRNHKDPYIIKADISKFFYSVDREILKRIIAKHIKCERTIGLLYKIIDSSPGDKGLPLGNLTSQQLANVYMNEIDQFCKRELSIKHYVRYADDIFIIVDGKEKAKEVLKRLREETAKRLNLSIPLRKCQIKPLRMGVTGLGVKIKPTHIMLTSRIKRSFERSIRNLIKYPTRKNERICSSKLAYISNFCHRNFISSILSKYPMICYKPHSNSINLRGVT